MSNSEKQKTDSDEKAEGGWWGWAGAAAGAAVALYSYYNPEHAQELLASTANVAVKVADIAYDVDRAASIRAACESCLEDVPASDFLICYGHDAAHYSTHVYDDDVDPRFTVVKVTEMGALKRICMTYFDSTDGTFWIIFRGTQNMYDCVVNASIASGTFFSDIFRYYADLPIGHPDGYLDGECLLFSEVALSMAEVMDALKLVESRVRRIIVTGHSLGGARAKAAFYILKQKHLPIGDIRVISFGAPLIFRRELGRAESSNMYHVINGFDVVPRLLGQHDLPDLSVLFSFSERMQVVYDNLLRNRSNYIPCGRYYTLVANELKLCSDPNKLLSTFPTSANLLRLDKILGDHSMESSYKSGITQYLSRGGKILSSPKLKNRKEKIEEK
jgi:hypothetical protein